MKVLALISLILLISPVITAEPSKPHARNEAVTAIFDAAALRSRAEDFVHRTVATGDADTIGKVRQAYTIASTLVNTFYVTLSDIEGVDPTAVARAAAAADEATLTLGDAGGRRTDRSLVAAAAPLVRLLLAVLALPAQQRESLRKPIREQRWMAWQELVVQTNTSSDTR